MIHFPPRGQWTCSYADMFLLSLVGRRAWPMVRDFRLRLALLIVRLAESKAKRRARGSSGRVQSGLLSHAVCSMTQLRNASLRARFQLAHSRIALDELILLAEIEVYNVKPADAKSKLERGFGGLLSKLYCNYCSLRPTPKRCNRLEIRFRHSAIG